jgi:uncharacterized membrane protein YgcG
MNVIHRVRVGFVASALFTLASLTFAGQASAGTLQVRDTEHVLSSSDASRLRSVVEAAPFDARLVVTSEYADAQELSRYVGSIVREPNLVAVGLDTVHRHVEVHFGEGDRIPRADWASIERAGNDAFKQANWEGGVAAIFQAASHSALSATGQAAPASGAGGYSLFGPGLLLLLLVGGLGLAFVFARRRAMGGAGYGAPPYSNDYNRPGYGPGYGPGYPPQGGMGPVGGGLIGAGLGGLAGYEIGKYEGEREERNREGQSREDDRGNFDAGGGGSSWDDSGGGGGGGFDGGGGGNDGGGGGGSDF